ncbi:MAG: type II toxin-antitoxin system HicA family toxin [Armatimonadetes bacterium]|nr:type II toxin-antitoxin system HicA family toxin [Armatimonadota bacterium]
MRYLKESGCEEVKEGGSHTHVRNAKNGNLSTVPRHEDIQNPTAWRICRDLGIAKPPFR